MIGMLQLYQDTKIGGIVRRYVAHTEEIPMRVPDIVKECVAFACYKDNRNNVRFAGTVFFVSIPIDGENRYSYTVTAKHVIVDMRLRGVSKVYLRLNYRNGGVGLEETSINDWKFHPDDGSVDVAVLDWSPSPSDFDYRFIPGEMFLNDETVRDGVKRFGMLEYKIGVGDEVYITGLFTNHHGNNKNLPIIRIGNIALMPEPEELISTRYFGDIEAYLIESRSIGGLSGSPVFVHYRTGGGGSTHYLLGLIHGHWDMPIPNVDGIVDDLAGEKNVNMGIAIVVPSPKMLEVINQPHFIELREKEMKKIKGKLLPVEDVAEDEYLTRERFEDILKRVTHPVQSPKQPDPKKKGT